MESAAIIYNNQWTSECLKNLTKEKRELENLYDLIAGVKYSVDERYLAELNKIQREVLGLKDNITSTYRTMNQYMSDMEKAINIIAEKIAIANAVGAKIE